ncbi:TMEM175 family protein [Dellaglioa sp. BT-FLS60]
MEIISKNRLEAFSDGVIAIIITIMVLQINVPMRGSWNAVLAPNFLITFGSYILSFLFVASFWVSHHMILAPVKTVSKKLLWVNLFLLLPMSVLPTVTTWHSDFVNSVAPSVCYIAIYTLCVLGLYVLAKVAMKHVDKSNIMIMESVAKIRFWMVMFGIVSTIGTFFIPQIATISVMLILIGYHISVFILNKLKWHGLIL